MPHRVKPILYSFSEQECRATFDSRLFKAGTALPFYACGRRNRKGLIMRHEYNEFHFLQLYDIPWPDWFLQMPTSTSTL